ncbi:MAG: nucleoid-associated protein YgaU [Candidatus Paceibacteria bacterium]|jgi:nucleoid-associated protein YgaU
MGQFEKIVVLLALFLVTAILVVTFSEDGESGLLLQMGPDDVAKVETSEVLTPQPLVAKDENGVGSNPRTRHEERGGPFLDQETNGEPMGLEALSLQDRNRQDREGRGDLFLDDRFSVRPTAPAQIPTGSALVTLDGLRTTWDASIMEYDWQREDSWYALAEQFYGSGDMSPLLRQFNEGASYIAPGTPVLIPVYDRRHEGDTGTDVVLGSKSSREDLSEERGNLYRAVDGDSLWVISKKVYGTGTLWEKIYKANTDVMSSPDSVKPGMKLRIP